CRGLVSLSIALFFPRGIGRPPIEKDSRIMAKLQPTVKIRLWEYEVTGMPIAGAKKSATMRPHDPSPVVDRNRHDARDFRGPHLHPAEVERARTPGRREHPTGGTPRAHPLPGR